MFFDDMLEDPAIPFMVIDGRRVHLKDAKVFMIDDDHDDMARKFTDDVYDSPTQFDTLVPRNSPFENTAFVFHNNSVVWCVNEEDGDTLYLGYCNRDILHELKTSIYRHVDMILAAKPGLRKDDIYNPFNLHLEVSKNMFAGNSSFSVEAFTKPSPLEDPSQAKAKLALRAALVKSYFAMTRVLDLLSCKNITTRTIQVDAKRQKKRQKRGKLPLFSYHVLEIDPKSIKNYESRANQGLWSNRVHMCRGHINRYVAERPHVSGFVGNMWISPHVRGNKKKGKIVKDYKVVTSV